VPGVLSEVLGPVYHKSFASKEVYSEGNAFEIDFFLGAFPEVFALFKTVRVHYTVLKHFSVLLAKLRVLFRIWLKKLFPN